ncbi:TVP38/TMEM64 family protein [Williamsia sp. CHRR-6]|nr:TVP38/TMEM64 family protein [Williamsia sp. CHRR-6]
MMGVFAAVAVVAAVVGLPDTEQFRTWSASLGGWFVLVFVVVHALVCITPIPRTIFTLASGVMFGPILGLAVAVGATMTAAVAAFVLVRAVGGHAVADRITHPAARAVARRLDRRGWLAVGSLRMIAPVPFSILNYLAALSPIRLVPYVCATFVGILPGTVSVVLLGSVLSGGAHPVNLIISAAGVALGLIGMGLDAWLPVTEPTAGTTTADDIGDDVAGNQPATQTTT